jgi:pyridoxal biosynthesis lyase PdxS
MLAKREADMTVILDDFAARRHRPQRDGWLRLLGQGKVSLAVAEHAALVMELGFVAVFLNTAVAKAADPVSMARAFGKAESMPAGKPIALGCSSRAMSP